MTGIILGAAALLLAIGYFRSVMGNTQPGFVMDIHTIVKDWISGNKWMSYFAPLFALPLVLFNIIAWIVYGILSIADLLSFFLQKIWWLIKWGWFEVLHPTVFALARLVWHYAVVWSFRLFQFSVLHIAAGFKKENLLYAWRILALPVLMVTLLGIMFLLTQHVVLLVFGGVIALYTLQYVVFKSLTYYRPNEFLTTDVFPALKLSVIWLGVASVSIALLVLVHRFTNVYFVQALSVTLVQLLLPVAIVFGSAFLLTTFYLPAFVKEFRDQSGIVSFWKVTLCRLPRLLAAQHFQGIGLLVCAIVPLIVFLALNAGLRQITGQSFAEHGKHAFTIAYHLPAVQKNKDLIEQQYTLLAQLQKEQDSTVKVFDQHIAQWNNELNDAKQLKARIKDNSIHTFDRAAYVGEVQSFSIPEVPGCAVYIWRIVNASNNALVRTVTLQGGEGTGSSVLYHQWARPGTYQVSLVQPPGCGTGVAPSIQVEVLPTNDTVAIPETSYFVTREAASFAIELLQSELSAQEKRKEQWMEAMKNERNITHDTINHVQFQSNEHWHMLLAKILTIIGLAILGWLILGVLWTFFVTFHFDVFSFGSEGKHFYTQLGEEIKARNPLQPWLGLFVLVVCVGLALVLCSDELSFFMQKWYCHLF